MVVPFSVYRGMSRPLRFIPAGGCLTEVTNRTIQGRFLLRPSEEFNQIAIGILARAARRYRVQVMAAVYLSNHYHLLLWAEDAEQLSRFMNYHNGNLAREAGRLHGWRDKFWSDRYKKIWVSEEEEAQVARLKYLLSHGAKEALVARPQDWPGVHCAEALLTGQPLEGSWIHRTREGAARSRGRRSGSTTYEEAESLHFARLPCWAHLSDEAHRQRIGDLLADIEQEAVAMRRREKIRLPGRWACQWRILRQHPHSAPERLEKRPLPLVHAFRKEVRDAWRQAYGWFVAAYRRASKRLRAGERGVVFPVGCFPPGLPFVVAGGLRSP